MKNIAVLPFKYLAISFLFLLSTSLQAQIKPRLLEVIQEKVSGGYKIYAKNTNACPVSLFFDFQANNTCGIPKGRILVEAKAEKQFLFYLSACQTQEAYKFTYQYTYWLGDTELLKYDEKFTYMLPFSEGASYKVIQGYFGNYSHQAEYAIDFKMPEGSKVTAMREGIVVLVKEDSNRGGGSITFVNDGNFVLIYHSDGTFANYYHFKKSGCVVKEGDIVRQGQLIGYSGNTGWSSEPHLHVDIFSFKPMLNEKNMLTYPAFFMVGKNRQTTLEFGKTYTSVRP
ncbi:MAG: M23 family metallopeptidase [Thermonemataceae bacterium]|nr:M23 family metallopeptidase [Thermonemataceae bacterium]